MARVMTSGSVSKAGRPTLGGSEECLSFHQSSTNTYNETKKESRSSMAPSFGESLVHQHTILAPSLFFAITHQTSKRAPPGAPNRLPEVRVYRCRAAAGLYRWSCRGSRSRTPPRMDWDRGATSVHPSILARSASLRTRTLQDKVADCLRRQIR